MSFSSGKRTSKIISNKNTEQRKKPSQKQQKKQYHLSEYLNTHNYSFNVQESQETKQAVIDNHFRYTVNSGSAQLKNQEKRNSMNEQIIMNSHKDILLPKRDSKSRNQSIEESSNTATLTERGVYIVEEFRTEDSQPVKKKAEFMESYHELRKLKNKRASSMEKDKGLSAALNKRSKVPAMKERENSEMNQFIQIIEDKSHELVLKQLQLAKREVKIVQEEKRLQQSNLIFAQRLDAFEKRLQCLEAKDRELENRIQQFEKEKQMQLFLAQNILLTNKKEVKCEDKQKLEIYSPIQPFQFTQPIQLLQDDIEQYDQNKRQINQNLSASYIFIKPELSQKLKGSFEESIYLHEDKKRRIVEICIICEHEFKEKEKIIVLQCRHFYHMSCINIWLKKNSVCPSCEIQMLK